MVGEDVGSGLVGPLVGILVGWDIGRFVGGRLGGVIAGPLLGDAVGGDTGLIVGVAEGRSVGCEDGVRVRPTGREVGVVVVDNDVGIDEGGRVGRWVWATRDNARAVRTCQMRAIGQLVMTSQSPAHVR